MDLRLAQQNMQIRCLQRDPRIIAQSSDPRFAQQNPRMVQIRTLRLTYIYTRTFDWNNIHTLYIRTHFVARILTKIRSELLKDMYLTVLLCGNNDFSNKQYSEQ